MVKKRQADLDVGSLSKKPKGAPTLTASPVQSASGDGKSIVSLVNKSKKDQKLKKEKREVTHEPLVELMVSKKSKKRKKSNSAGNLVLFPPIPSYPGDNASSSLSVADRICELEARVFGDTSPMSSKASISGKKKKGSKKDRNKAFDHGKNAVKKKKSKGKEKSTSLSSENPTFSKPNKKATKQKQSVVGHDENGDSLSPACAVIDITLDSPTKQEPKLNNKPGSSAKKAKKRVKFDLKTECSQAVQGQTSGTPSIPHTATLSDNSVTDYCADETKSPVVPYQKPSAQSSPSNIQTALQDLAKRTLSIIGNSPNPCDSVPAKRRTQAVWAVTSSSWIVAFSSRIELRGFVTINSLTEQGAVEVHGYKLEYQESINVYAPPGYHNGVVEYHLPPRQQISVPCINKLRDNLSSLDPDIVDQVAGFCQQHPECALLMFSELERRQLQPCVDMLPMPKVTSGYVSLRPRLLISDCKVAPRYSPQVGNAIQHLVSHQQSGYPLRVVVCGDRNLGKSTLIRYLINRLLPSCERGVTHLECDPGQCEFTPPGCLTLHTTTQPLLGPPWTHIAEPVDHCQAYGSISADIDPGRYVECFRSLVGTYRAMEAPTPLVVNTMGWKQGLGLHFLAATIAEVNPTHVIQLGTDGVSYKNFEAFTVLRLALHDMFIPVPMQSKLHAELNYELMPLTMNHSNKLQHESDLLTPILNRDLAMTAYMFLSSLPEERVINDILPYHIGMHNIALNLGTDSLPSYTICQALVMQVVILCQAPRESINVSLVNPDFLVLSHPVELNVIGYGVVRATDLADKELYVISPIPADRMAKVNVLLKINGTVTPELWFYQQLCKVNDSQGLPYLGNRKSGMGNVSTAEARYRFRCKQKVSK